LWIIGCYLRFRVLEYRGDLEVYVFEKDGSTAGTGKKKLTLNQFELRYSEKIIRPVKRVRTNNF
jgi:hypothetical protein